MLPRRHKINLKKTKPKPYIFLNRLCPWTKCLEQSQIFFKLLDIKSYNLFPK